MKLVGRVGVGATDAEEAKEKIFIDGQGNFYTGSMVMLRFHLPASDGEYRDHTFDDRNGPWYAEKSPDLTVMWKPSATTDLPVHKHTAANYLLDESRSNPALDASGDPRAGFDPAMLPTIPPLPGDDS